MLLSLTCLVDSKDTMESTQLSSSCIRIYLELERKISHLQWVSVFFLSQMVQEGVVSLVISSFLQDYVYVE